jgi:hypothetical protein
MFYRQLISWKWDFKSVMTDWHMTDDWLTHYWRMIFLANDDWFYSRYHWYPSKIWLVLFYEWFLLIKENFQGRISGKRL